MITKLLSACSVVLNFLIAGQRLLTVIFWLIEAVSKEGNHSTSKWGKSICSPVWWCTSCAGRQQMSLNHKLLTSKGFLRWLVCWLTGVACVVFCALRQSTNRPQILLVLPEVSLFRQRKLLSIACCRANCLHSGWMRNSSIQTSKYDVTFFWFGINISWVLGIICYKNPKLQKAYTFIF